MINKTIKDIQYKELLRRMSELKRIQRLGCELTYNTSRFKVISGLVLCSVGLITLPFPTGSIVMISLGLSLMASGGLNIYLVRRNLLNKFNRFFL